MATDAAWEGDLRVPFLPQSDTAIVCGGAWCLLDDYRRARLLFPHAAVIAVNEGARHVQAQMLFTLHPRKFERWIEAQRRFEGPFTTHSSGTRQTKTRLGRELRNRLPWVQFWWPEAATPGGSGWGARRLARFVGFDKVVLCGVPMSPGKYQEGSKAMPKAWRDESLIRHYRASILKEKDWHDGVSSMSGWTREVFGEPAIQASGRSVSGALQQAR